MTPACQQADHDRSARKPRLVPSVPPAPQLTAERWAPPGLWRRRTSSMWYDGPSACSTSAPRVLKLGPEVLDLLGALAQLGVGGPLADAGQGPAYGLRPVGREPGRDQRVQGLQVGRPEPGHHRGQLTRQLVRHGRSPHEFAAVTLAGDELEPVSLRPPCANIELKLPERIPLDSVERAQGILVAFRLGRGCDGHLHHDLARLDRRIVAVLQHRDAVHYALWEASPDLLLDELGGGLIQAFHRILLEIP